MTDGSRVPRVRYRALPARGSVVVVRGDDLDPASDRRQAEAFRRRFPDWHRYGLSAYFAEDDEAVDDVASDQLERFPMLVVYSPADLDGVGVETVPTFRSPHVTLAFDDLDKGLAALDRVRRERRPNPYHGEERRTP
jgi:hypothetical protein